LADRRVGRPGVSKSIISVLKEGKTKAHDMMIIHNQEIRATTCPVIFSFQFVTFLDK